MNLGEIQTSNVAGALGLDATITREMIEALLRIWGLSAHASSFPCVARCVDCCSNAAITCSRLEYETIMVHYPAVKSNAGFGCVFKTKAGCAVYPMRPLVCRMFGYYVPFDAPSVVFRESLMGQPLALSVGTPGFCKKKRIKTEMSYANIEEIMAIYKNIVDKTKIVTLGTFKDKDLNNGLENIDRVWQEKNGMRFWIRSV